MTKRRLIRWLVMLVTIVALAVWLEPTRVVWGWLRGEAFYHGRPTSYWRNVIERDLHTDPGALFANVFRWKLSAGASWWDRCRDWIDERLPKMSSQELINWNKNETAGVLRALANDPDERIAGFAEDAMHCRPWTAPHSYWLMVIRKHQ